MNIRISLWGWLKSFSYLGSILLTCRWPQRRTVSGDDRTLSCGVTATRESRVKSRVVRCLQTESVVLQTGTGRDTVCSVLPSPTTSLLCTYDHSARAVVERTPPRITFFWRLFECLVCCPVTNPASITTVECKREVNWRGHQFLSRCSICVFFILIILFRQNPVIKYCYRNSAVAARKQ